jgi:RimJ/RimL family protein N-acetyltransferase
MKAVNIKTAHLTIRHLELKDVSDFYSYRSNPEVVKYQGFDVMTVGEAEKFIEENASRSFGEAGEWVQYAIEDNQAKRLIGDCAIKLDQHDTRIAEIGITISHLEQQKGYGREALLGILAFLFDTQGVHRVVGIVDAENLASIHLLKSTGFRQEGHFIENVFFKGAWASEFQYAMLEREWKARDRRL